MSRRAHGGAVEQLVAPTRDGGRAPVWLATDVVDDGGALVARVREQLYVRREDAGRRTQPVTTGR